MSCKLKAIVVRVLRIISYFIVLRNYEYIYIILLLLTSSNGGQTFVAHVVVSMLQIWLTHYLPYSVILYITSFGVRRHVSFTFIMVSVILRGLRVLW